MARRGTFSFDLSKPTKKGRLLKQGGFHKAFKSREFILYPGFLVYYDNENEWRLDITKGQLGVSCTSVGVLLESATVGSNNSFLLILDNSSLIISYMFPLYN